MSTLSKRCRVTGRVQGVWFRASTQQQAQHLGVTGYARNLPDGSVEVLACGPASAVGELESWLWQGPEAAEVSDVACETVNVDPPAMFVIG